MPYNFKSTHSPITPAQLFKAMQRGDTVFTERWPEPPWLKHYVVTRCKEGKVYLHVDATVLDELLSTHKIRKVSAPRWAGGQFDTYHLMIVRNAAELLQLMQAGAILTSRWRYGKRINNLKLPTGENLIVQYSNIQSLQKHDKIRGIHLSGDNYDYYLVKP